MPCYHQLTAWRSRRGADPKTGKVPLVFKARDGLPKTKLAVACGRCIGCRLERARQWAMRCMAEKVFHDENCFITLTYDPVNLERKCRIVDDIDSSTKDYSLNKKEFTNFMKRLRKKVWNERKQRIKFFHCGEYGEKYGRPHHHVCVFGWFPDDVIPWGGSKLNRLFSSESVNDLWKNGHCVIGEVTFESCSYVARYITKKILGEYSKEFYRDIQPEYVTCSNREAIGREWYEIYKRDLENDTMLVRDGRFARPPKYFDKLLEKDDPLEIENRKEKRRAYAAAQNTPRWRKLQLEKLKERQLKFRKKRTYENE